MRSTGPESFELSEKGTLRGENPVPMSDRLEYEYTDIARAEPVSEEGNSTRGFVLGTTVIVVALFAVIALVATFPVPSS